jgi:catechol 2,3-dioxygenase-like lactoylglutathione lyase family enzyme
MRLSSAMVYVKDLPRMRAFYTEMLGVKPSTAATSPRAESGKAHIRG